MNGIKKHRVARFCLTYDLAIANPPGPRRLRFPSFKFNCQRAKSRTQNRPECELRVFRDNEFPTGRSGGEPQSFEVGCPARAAKQLMRRQRDPVIQHRGSGVNTHFKKSLPCAKPFEFLAKQPLFLRSSPLTKVHRSLMSRVTQDAAAFATRPPRLPCSVVLLCASLSFVRAKPMAVVAEISVALTLQG